MKQKIKMLLLITIVIISAKFNTTISQVTLEHTYLTRATGQGQEFWLTNLGNNNYKYVIYDYDSSKFSLYNLNHTPFMLNIQIPFPVVDTATNTYYRLGYITTNLFDCDSTTIKYAMMLDYVRPTKHPNFAIYKTDGTLIFSKDTVATVFCVGCGSGSYEMHPIMNTSAGAKLYLFNNNINGYTQTFVYDLCGSLPENIEEIDQSNFLVSVYPNPTSHNINFEITAPFFYL